MIRIGQIQPIPSVSAQECWGGHIDVTDVQVGNGKIKCTPLSAGLNMRGEDTQTTSLYSFDKGLTIYVYPFDVLNTPIRIVLENVSKEVLPISLINADAGCHRLFSCEEIRLDASSVCVLTIITIGDITQESAYNIYGSHQDFGVIDQDKTTVIEQEILKRQY